MKARYWTHPKHKASGVEWVGQITVHWDIQRLKCVTHIDAGQSSPSGPVAELDAVSPTAHQICDAAPPRVPSLSRHGLQTAARFSRDWEPVRRRHGV